MKENKRPNKGSSLLDFPNSYTVIDIETTGLDHKYDKIIEVAAIKYSNGQIVDKFESLIRPDSYIEYETGEEIDGDFIEMDGLRIQYVDDFIINLTKITNKMLHNADPASVVLPKFYDFIKSDTLIGHNVHFDINFLYDEFENLGICFSNDFIDTLRFAKLWLKNLESRSLYDLMTYYKLPNNTHHRALSDCESANQVFEALKADILSKYPSAEDFYKDNTANHGSHQVKAAHVTANVDTSDINPDNPIYNNHFVFTGKLENLTRKDAFQVVVDHGGFNDDNVTKKTNYLVLGNLDYCNSIKDGKSLKQKKAEAYMLKGQEISVISENVFLDMLD